MLWETYQSIETVKVRNAADRAETKADAYADDIRDISISLKACR